MLIPKEWVVKDPCQVSVDILKARVRAYFEAHRESKARHIWFADHYEDMPRVSRDGVVDVVFFGSFVKRFLESGNWLEGNYRFWCLTGSVRTALSRLIGVPDDAIGVIPRSALFPPKKTKPLPPAKSAMTFVFGGRLSATKNLELLVRTVNALQWEWKLDVELVLSGDFDDRFHPDRGTRRDEDHGKHLDAVIRQMEWKKAPVFRHGLGPRNWTKQEYTNPIYVNLSTYVYEDFDVSLAQAQAAGWPAIVSDWGGHRDVESGPGVIKIPPAMIGHAHEGSSLTQLRARALAATLARALKKKTPSSKAPKASKTRTSKAPRLLSTNEIDSVRRSFFRRLGPGGLTLQRRGLEGFWYEPASEKFFATYRACFAAPYQGHGVAVLVNDFHDSKDPVVAEIPSICAKILDERRDDERDVIFLPTNEILQPMNAMVVTMASEILVPFESKHFAPLLKHWKKDLQVSARVFQLVPKAKRRGGKLAFVELRS